MASFPLDLDANSGPVIELEQLGVRLPNGKTYWADGAGRVVVWAPGTSQGITYRLGEFEVFLRNWQKGLSNSGLPIDGNLLPTLVRRTIIVAVGKTTESD